MRRKPRRGFGYFFFDTVITEVKDGEKDVFLLLPPRPDYSFKPEEDVWMYGCMYEVAG